MPRSVVGPCVSHISTNPHSIATNPRALFVPLAAYRSSLLVELPMTDAFEAPSLPADEISMSEGDDGGDYSSLGGEDAKDPRGYQSGGGGGGGGAGGSSEG